jgi:hypothetical protein
MAWCCRGTRARALVWREWFAVERRPDTAIAVVLRIKEFVERREIVPFGGSERVRSFAVHFEDCACVRFN